MQGRAQQAAQQTQKPLLLRPLLQARPAAASDGYCRPVLRLASGTAASARPPLADIRPRGLAQRSSEGVLGSASGGSSPESAIMTCSGRAEGR